MLLFLLRTQLLLPLPVPRLLPLLTLLTLMSLLPLLLLPQLLPVVQLLHRPLSPPLPLSLSLLLKPSMLPLTAAVFAAIIDAGAASADVVGAAWVWIRVWSAGNVRSTR